DLHARLAGAGGFAAELARGVDGHGGGGGDQPRGGGCDRERLVHAVVRGAVLHGPGHRGDGADQPLGGVGADGGGQRGGVAGGPFGGPVGLGIGRPDEAGGVAAVGVHESVGGVARGVPAISVDCGGRRAVHGGDVRGDRQPARVGGHVPAHAGDDDRE